MKRFCFEWFDKCEWSWMQGEIVAASKEVAETYLKQNQYVDATPYGDGETSLRLIREEEIPIPSFLDGPKKRIAY